jgi:hypothetical protein
MLRVKAIAGSGLVLLLVLTAAPIVGSAQVFERPRRTSSSYDRSYEIGYDEGYRVGFDRGIKARQNGDSKSATDYKEYRRADDGYNDSIGSRESYKLGYRSGFEQGLDDGYSGQQYGGRPGVGRVQLPPGGGGGGGPVLRRNGRGQVDNYPPPGGYPDPYGNGAPVPNAGPYGYPGGAGARVGYNMSMLIELETPITTRYSQEGDRFTARVLEPSSYYGARVEGYIGKLKRPGKLSGKGEIVLVFQEMIFPDGSAEPMAAQVEEVVGYPRGVPRAGNRGPLSRAPWDWGKKQDDRNDDIDAQAGDEGQIEGEGSHGRDAAVIGGSTAAGAVIGTVIGGGGGAAVGAVIGAVAGGGIVGTTRGHEIDLEPGAQLRIRTGQGTRF